MARRGFFAELQHAARVAARNNERTRRAAVREHNAAVRQASQAQKALERIQAQLARTAEVERKRLEKEARDAYLATKEAEVNAKNLELAEIYDDIDSLLAATLDVDDYVDLDALRVVVQHPPFERSDLEAPIALPKPIPDPPQPRFLPPAPPKGLAALFGKSRHITAVEKARQAHEAELVRWRTELERTVVRRKEAADAHERAEAERLASLKAARTRYSEQCAIREAEASKRNKELDELKVNLGYGTAQAVQEYVSVVLANSVYPEHFSVTHEFQFESSSAELTLRVLVPGPDKVPAIKAYKYTKATDEVITTALSTKICRDRYAAAVHQVTLRSIHEVFESDRRGLIKTISLQVGAEMIDPATGRETYVPFVVVGAEREQFLEFDLSAVIPALTLERLGAAISKDPYALAAADTSGVRRS
jgi:restriction system protein